MTTRPEIRLKDIYNNKKIIKNNSASGIKRGRRTEKSSALPRAGKFNS